MPQITEATPRGKLTIQGLEFDYSMPYAPGAIELTEGEASTLNQVRGENLRNNFASTIKKLKEDQADKYRKENGLAEDADVPADAIVLDHATLAGEFADYDKEYEFGVRKAGSGPRVPVDPVEREAFKIAQGIIRDAAKAKGLKISSISDEQMENLIENLLNSKPDIREEARRRVETASEFASADVLAGLAA